MGNSQALLNNLLKEKEELTARINRIEEEMEGIDNSSNAEKIKQMEKEKADLVSNKEKLKGIIQGIEAKINEINVASRKLSYKGQEIILEAIKKQRWFFIKNKPNVLFDKITGYLWPNLDYFQYKVNHDQFYTVSACRTMVKSLVLNGYSDWRLPLKQDMIDMIDDKSFPFTEENGRLILDNNCVYIDNIGGKQGEHGMWLDGDYPKLFAPSTAIFIPCYKGLVNETYRNNIKPENKVYSEKERLQFTLDIFIENDFIPIFQSNEITELYKQIFDEKPRLIERLNEIQLQLNGFQQEMLLSSTFNYKLLLEDYDLGEIDSSILKYYQSIQMWIDKLLDRLDYFEKIKGEIISESNVIGLSLSKKYENKIHLSDEENKLFENRRAFFKRNFELGMNTIKNNLLSIKQQAEEYEDRIENIHSGLNSLKELAEIEVEKRPSFQLVAEYTSNLLKKGLIKLEYFEKNREFSSKAVTLEAKWLNEYEILLTKLRDDFKNSCEEDSIEGSIWQIWFENWRKMRFIIEGQFQPLIEIGLNGKLKPEIIGKLLGLLQIYKEDVDQFYLEERKDIHQKFAFQSGGDLQEKFEVESNLYKLTSILQQEIQELIFGLDQTEEKLLVLKLTEKIMDIQIDEILAFISEKDLLIISQEVLAEFANLKQKNFEIYLSDIKAYTEEAARREKEYNSLIFRMRKDLMRGQKVEV